MPSRISCTSQHVPKFPEPSLRIVVYLPSANVGNGDTETTDVVECSLPNAPGDRVGACAGRAGPVGLCTTPPWRSSTDGFIERAGTDLPNAPQEHVQLGPQ
eukprot:m.422360 g.422360  ORF g.422360 m.422360 type:complete len:101 (+) comp37231_c0_seq1:1997-2299(+)